MLDVRDDDRLKAAALVMKNIERPIVREINTRTRTSMNPTWKGLVETHSTRHMDARVLAKGSRVKAGNPPTLVAASSRRALPGGLVPAQQWAAFEFGASTSKVTKYRRRSKNGGTHEVSRHTARQLPSRIRQGRVVYPAVAEIAPRFASLWVQTIVRTVMEGIERVAR